MFPSLSFFSPPAKYLSLFWALAPVLLINVSLDSSPALISIGTMAFVTLPTIERTAPVSSAEGVTSWARACEAAKNNEIKEKII